MRKFWLFVAVGVAGISCQAVIRHKYDQTVRAFITAINSQNAEALSKMTQTPFLLDGEIIVLASDMDTFWQDLTTSGFKFTELQGTEIIEKNPATYKIFAESREIEFFFANYTSEKTYLALINTQKYRFYLLLTRNKSNQSVIIGLKGPEEL